MANLTYQFNKWFSAATSFNVKKKAINFVIIMLAFSALSLILVNVGNSMDNNPKAQEYAIAKQEIENSRIDFLEALPDQKVEKLNNLSNQTAARKQKLLSDLNENPSLFLKNATLGVDRSNYPEEVRENIEENVELEGKFQIITMDQPGHPPTYEYMLETTNGRYTLKTTKEPNLKSNSKIRIKGVRIDDQIAYSPDEPSTLITELALPQNTLITNAKVAVVLFKFTNTTTEPFTPTDAEYKFLGAQDSVKNYYIENSMNQMTFSATTFGWYQIAYNNTGGCDYITWSNAVDQLMKSNGVNLTGYNYIFYIFPYTDGCISSAWASIGGKTAWSRGDIDSRTLGHELGHNFGLAHASSINCDSKSIDIPNNCTLDEYGDYYDLMGNYWYMQTSVHFNAAHKLALGWIPASNAQTITSSGTYTVNSAEVTQPGPQALKIRKNNTNDFYYISKKQNIGYDQSISTDITNGVSIHEWDENAYVPTKLIDTTPQSAPYETQDVFDSSLLDGREFFDDINNIKIKQISHTDSSATVQVTLPQVITPTPTKTPTPTPTKIPTPTPTITVTPTPTTTPIPTLTPTPTPVMNSQLIKNDSFTFDKNKDNKPDDWSKNPNFTRSMITAHSGSFSGKHKSNSNASYSNKQYISNIKGGTNYSFSSWTKILSNNDSYFRFIISIKWRNSNKNVIATSTIKTYNSSTNGWKKSVKEIKAPANATSVIVNMEVKSLKGTIFVDDFSLKEIN